MKKRISRIFLGFFVVLLLVVLLYLNYVAGGITGYAAKGLASGVFLSGRSQESLEQEDLNFSFMKYTKNKVDRDAKRSPAAFCSGRRKRFTMKVLDVLW